MGASNSGDSIHGIPCLNSSGYDYDFPCAFRNIASRLGTQVREMGFQQGSTLTRGKRARRGVNLASLRAQVACFPPDGKPGATECFLRAMLDTMWRARLRRGHHFFRFAGCLSFRHRSELGPRLQLPGDLRDPAVLQVRDVRCHRADSEAVHEGVDEDVGVRRALGHADPAAIPPQATPMPTSKATWPQAPVPAVATITAIVRPTAITVWTQCDRRFHAYCALPMALVEARSNQIGESIANALHPWDGDSLRCSR